MYSIRKRESHFSQQKSRDYYQKNKYDLEGLRTNPSFFTKTLETQDSRIHFEQTYQFSPQQMEASKTFDQRAFKKLPINSQIRAKLQIDEQSIMSLFSDIKILKFILNQNEQTKLYISKKQKYINTLRLQIEEKEEKIKYQNMQYQKKVQRLQTRKRKINKVKSKKLQMIQEQVQQLAYNIKKMKNKIKIRKLRTEPIDSSFGDYKHNIGNPQPRNRALPPYYFNNMVHHQPYFYLQHQVKPTSHQNHSFHHFPQMENGYQWQNRLNQSNFNKYNVQIHKMRTQATDQYKPNNQLLTSSRKRSNGFQNPQNPNKNQKVQQLRSSSHRSSFKMTKSINMKSSKKQQLKNNEEKHNNILGDLNYFTNSECQSENQSRFITINKEKQIIKSRTTPLQILNKEESVCFTYIKPEGEELSSEEWMELMDQTKNKPNKKSIPQNVVLDTIKVLEDKSQKNSSKGSNFSNVNVNVTISSEDKNKQTVRSSSESSKKRSVGQSIVTISMGGMSSSKISKNSKDNSVREELGQVKQINRYMPYLTKQFMKIEQENEQVASLKTTPNEFGTPINSSMNQKSIIPTNSNNKKKISTIEQEQQPHSPLKKPPALDIEKMYSQQLQNDAFLSKIRLNTHSKNFPDLTPITTKEDDDFLGTICLVGQSKISRLKSQSQRMLASETNNDIDEIGSLKVNSQIKKQPLQKDSSIDDFDFDLSGQSRIIKNKQTPNRFSLQYSPQKNTQEKSRFSRNSLGFQQKDNTIQQQQEQYEDYPSNKADQKNKKKV